MPKTDRYRQKLEKSLDKFKQDCLKKYDKGRREHNDDLALLDIDKEFHDELLDLVIYYYLKEICHTTKPSSALNMPSLGEKTPTHLS
jgi:hypothetical protein